MSYIKKSKETFTFSIDEILYFYMRCINEHIVCANCPFNYTDKLCLPHNIAKLVKSFGFYPFRDYSYTPSTENIEEKLFIYNWKKLLTEDIDNNVAVFQYNSEDRFIFIAENKRNGVHILDIFGEDLKKYTNDNIAKVFYAESNITFNERFRYYENLHYTLLMNMRFDYNDTETYVEIIHTFRQIYTDFKERKIAWFNNG